MSLLHKPGFYRGSGQQIVLGVVVVCPWESQSRTLPVFFFEELVEELGCVEGANVQLEGNPWLTVAFNIPTLCPKFGCIIPGAAEGGGGGAGPSGV